MEIEEFEFRPITEGLGFHRKNNPLRTDKLDLANKGQVLDSIKSPIQQAASLSAQLGLDVGDAPAELIEDKPATSKSPWGEPIMRKPLPRTGDEKKAGPVHSTMAVSSAVARAASALNGTPAPVLPTATTLRNPVVPAVAPREAVVKTQMRAVAFSWSAAFVDAVLVLATSLVFLISLLLVTEVDLMAIMAQPSLNESAMLGLLIILMAVVQIYMVGLRGWAGATLGDWAFDVEVGNYLERAKLNFPLKLLGRSLLYTATGFVLMPALGAILKRDVIGQVTGLTLQSRN
jgi:hypothetical protein